MMSVTPFMIIALIVFLFVLAVSKAVTMWVTGMDISVKNQKVIIENQKEIYAVLQEIAQNTRQRRVEAPPPIVRQS